MLLTKSATSGTPIHKILLKSMETWNFKCLVQLVGSFILMDAHYHLLQALYPCLGALPEHETFIIEIYSLVRELLKMIWHCPKFSSVEIIRWFFFPFGRWKLLVRKKKLCTELMITWLYFYSSVSDLGGIKFIIT